MTEIHGVTGAPYATPQVRKATPAAHRRNRIDLDGGSRRVKRVWKDTSVLDLGAGDTVVDFGVLSEEPDLRFSALATTGSPWTVTLTNMLDERRTYGGHQRVYAFARLES